MRIPSSVPVPAIKRISDTDNSGGIPAIQRIFSEKLGGQFGEDSDDIWQTSGRRNFADNLGEQSAVDIRRRQSGGYIMSAEFSVGYSLDWISTDCPPVCTSDVQRLSMEMLPADSWIRQGFGTGTEYLGRWELQLKVFLNRSYMDIYLQKITAVSCMVEQDIHAY